MTYRGAPLLFLLLPACAIAGLQLNYLDRGVERPVTPLLDVGSAPVGDPVDLRFRLRNTGATAETVRTLIVTGGGFQLTGYPTLPFVVAPGSALDFVVRFTPPAAGYYSASIQYNHVAVFFRASAVAAASLVVPSEAGGAVLGGAAALDFGALETGERLERSFTLENRGVRPVQVRSVAVRGPAFQGPLGLTLPLDLSPGASAPLRIAFQPRTAGVATGELEIDGRVYSLRGVGIAIRPPKPSLEVSPAVIGSAGQGRVLVRLASPSRVAAEGEVRMEFHSSVPGFDADPAIGFLPGLSRVALFRIAEGDTAVSFGGLEALPFQTGTTAGALVFSVRLGGHSDQAAVTLEPEPVRIDLARALRAGSQLEIHLSGYDNMRSTSQLAFTFFDRAGRPVPPGEQRVDVTDSFRRYFETGGAGGAFLLRAVFPTTGNAAEITEAEMEIVNSVGSTRPSRVRFQ